MVPFSAFPKLFVFLHMKIFSQAAERTNREGHQDTGNEVGLSFTVQDNIVLNTVPQLFTFKTTLNESLNI